MNSGVDLFWQAYLINFLFWSSLAQGAVIFAAVLDIMTSRSMHQYVHIARRFSGFLLPSIVLFLGLALGSGDRIFPWIAHPIPEITGYLNLTFFTIRGCVGLTILMALSWIFLARTKVAIPDTHPKGASPWAVVLVIAYMITFYFLSTDLILSLVPYFYSTLFQAFYSFGAFYLGAAGLCIAGYMWPGITKEDRRKLALLIFGFAAFRFYLLWAMYIVMWYSDMPVLTQFVYVRFSEAPWEAVTWVVIGMVFVLPFLILLSKRAKLIGIFPLLASLIAAIGFFIEKFLFIVPSFSPGKWGIGWIHLWVTLAYALLFGLSYQVAARFLKKQASS